MSKKVLIAVDGSVNAQNAMMYAAGMFGRFSDCHITLINVLPIFPNYFRSELESNPRFNEFVKLVTNQNSVRSQEILSKSRELLITAGIKPENIDTISNTRAKGKVRDIIETGQTLGVEAIIAGYRGWDRKKYTVIGSNCAKLIENCGQRPIWIVDGAIQPKRFLVAIDMDATARNIVDYIASMNTALQDTEITFYHVLHDFFLSDMAPSFEGVGEINDFIQQQEKQIADDFWAHALERLIAAGYKKEQLQFQTPPRQNEIGRMIIAEAEDNNYDTLVLGRFGGDEASYFGHVPRYVSERLEDRALCIVG